MRNVLPKKTLLVNFGGGDDDVGNGGGSGGGTGGSSGGSGGEGGKDR